MNAVKTHQVTVPSSVKPVDLGGPIRSFRMRVTSIRPLRPPFQHACRLLVSADSFHLQNILRLASVGTLNEIHGEPRSTSTPLSYIVASLFLPFFLGEKTLPPKSQVGVPQNWLSRRWLRCYLTHYSLYSLAPFVRWLNVRWDLPSAVRFPSRLR